MVVGGDQIEDHVWIKWWLDNADWWWMKWWFKMVGLLVDEVTIDGRQSENWNIGQWPMMVVCLNFEK